MKVLAINDSGYYNSDENDAKSDSQVTTRTSDGNKKEKLRTLATEIGNKNY